MRDMLWCDGDCSGDAPERRANVRNFSGGSKR
jgi:hypothetical protein